MVPTSFSAVWKVDIISQNSTANSWQRNVGSTTMLLPHLFFPRPRITKWLSGLLYPTPTSVSQSNLIQLQRFYRSDEIILYTQKSQGWSNKKNIRRPLCPLLYSPKLCAESDTACRKCLVCAEPRHPALQQQHWAPLKAVSPSVFNIPPKYTFSPKWQCCSQRCSSPPSHTRKPTTKFPFQNVLLCRHDQYSGKRENTRKRTYRGKKRTILKAGSVQSLEIVYKEGYVHLNTRAWKNTAWHSYTFGLGFSQELSTAHSGELTNPLCLSVCCSASHPL